MRTTLLILSVLQFALHGHCQQSGPPITPPTLSLSTATSGSTLTSSGRSVSTSLSSSGTPTGSAQYPSLSGYPSCVSNCLAMGVAAANCTSVVDVNCFCIQSIFTQELYSCVNLGCPTELTSAESLAQQFCNVASASPTLSFPAISSTTSSTSMSSQPSSSPSSSIPSTTEPPQPTESSAALTLRPFGHSIPTFWASLLTALLAAFSGVLLA